MTTFFELRNWMEANCEAADMGQVLDDILYEYSFYVALHEDIEPEKAKKHLYYLHELRNIFLKEGGCRLLDEMD